MSKPVNEQAV